uniref:Uncharacterized protein n=1 Tax=Arundo donax TaxID=35708 RepID=A0A0A9AG28_ARUDO
MSSGGGRRWKKRSGALLRRRNLRESKPRPSRWKITCSSSK